MERPTESNNEVAELTKEIEIKYLINPEKFPEDLRTALLEGKDHPAIAEKGRISQLYLPITQETLKFAMDIIKDVPTEDYKETDFEYFSNIDNVSEIRILQREQTYVSDSKKSQHDEDASQEKGATKDPDAFQITLKGRASEDGSARPNMETPITTNKGVCTAVVKLLEHLNADKSMEWHKKVKIVEKMWYDLKIQNPINQEEELTVELDIFPDINYLAIAEIEFSPETDLDEVKSNLPSWFHKDITHSPGFKAKELAGKKNIEEIDDKEIDEITSGIKDKLAQVYQPTALGDALGKIKEDIRGMDLVILGSFKRWLPQFRRISQDLSRRSAGAYPRISTLDVARRQISTDKADIAFRIEVEETSPLENAELRYLTRIKNSDAVYLVAPESRVGRSSGQEAAYAVSKGKALLLSNTVDKVAEDMPDKLKILFSTIIHGILAGTIKDLIQRVDLTPHIMLYLQKVFKTESGDFDEEFLKTLMIENKKTLLSSSKTEDGKRKKEENKEL